MVMHGNSRRWSCKITIFAQYICCLNGTSCVILQMHARHAACNRKMSKLQLYIAKSQRGYKSLVNLNPEEDVRRFVGDFRNVLGKIGCDWSRMHVFLLVSYHMHGVMLTIIRTIPDVAGDHLAASVFVPDGIAITPDELEVVLDRTRGLIVCPAVDADGIAMLRSLFARDYPAGELKAARVNSEGRDYGYARCGGSGNHTLKDYAAGLFYTPSWAGYAGVLLVPDDGEATFSGPDATPVSLSPLIVLNPPAPTAEGFVPHIFRMPFNKPVLVPQGEKLEIVWKRSGFADIVTGIVPSGAGQAIEAPSGSEAVKTLTPASFLITAHGSRTVLESAQVRVNGREINSGVQFTYTELSPANVEIGAPGYLPFRGKLDLASTAQAQVQMKELGKTYHFDLPVDTPDPSDSVHFTIHSPKALRRCPVEGYVVSGEGLSEGAGRSNNLVYVGGRSRRSFFVTAIVAALALCIGFFLGWISFGFSQEEEIAAGDAVEMPEIADSAESPEPAADVPEPATPPARQVSSYAAAVAYLDANRVWDRNEMEATEGLAGLFDDINSYRFNRLTTYWGPLLAGSDSFSTVLEAVRRSGTKRNPRTGIHQPEYNREGDTKINWRGYTYWIDP